MVLNHSSNEPQQYRKQLRAHLAEAQAALLTALLGVDTAELTSPWLPGNRTPLDALTEQLDADHRVTAALERVLTQDATPDVEVAAFGAIETINRFLAARRLLLDTLARVPDEDLNCSVDGDATVIECMERRYVEEMGQAVEIARCEGRVAVPGIAPPILQLAALRAGRKALLTTIALIPEPDRPSHALVDGSSLLERIAQLARRDRDFMAASGLPPHPGPPPSSAPVWHMAWHDLHATRQRLLTDLTAILDTDLFRSTAVNERIFTLIEHDRVLAAELRDSLALHHPGGFSI